MGRTKTQGTKNLKIMLDSSRFQLMTFVNTTTNTRLAFKIAGNAASRERIVNGFMARGFDVVEDSQP